MTSKTKLCPRCASGVMHLRNRDGEIILQCNNKMCGYWKNSYKTRTLIVQSDAMKLVEKELILSIMDHDQAG